LYQEVLYYLKENNNELNVSILNRLDKDTEGLVLIAKNTYAASLLQPTHEHITRKYLAYCHGIFDKKEDRIILNIKKNGDNYKRIIASDGKESITNYKVLKEIEGNSLVEFILETGRTHQIRLTSSYLKHPLFGDVIYGNDDIDKLHLTSYYLSFINPFTKEEIKIVEDKPTWLSY
ncbi:MAG: RNA pseudouridine synthase, partial [Acholeplasmatales bacterium]|nr:RNA pseudouridine synthase [Acholeplasmatales bacterium]